MRTYKVNLKEGQKKAFGNRRGVKVKLINKQTPKQNK